MRLENIGDLIELNNKISKDVWYIERINKSIRSVNGTVITSRKIELMEQLIVAKQRLIREVTTLRRQAVDTMFKKSGNYTYSNEFSIYKAQKTKKSYTKRHQLMLFFVIIKKYGKILNTCEIVLFIMKYKVGEIFMNKMINKVNYSYLFIKRLFDVVISTTGIIFMIFLIPIVKIMNIINKDDGKIFFTQDRIGKNGKIFKIYKFRSMVDNTDEKLEKILEMDKQTKEEYMVNKKLRNDPRVTKTGEFLRKTSLDELPQFINILKNEMSLIGNRPYLLIEKEDMMDFYNDIVKTKPGLTGYWQVNGRNNTTFKERLELESFYSNNYSLKMDTKIFFKTFGVILLKKDQVEKLKAVKFDVERKQDEDSEKKEKTFHNDLVSINSKNIENKDLSIYYVDKEKADLVNFIVESMANNSDNNQISTKEYVKK